MYAILASGAFWAIIPNVEAWHAVWISTAFQLKRSCTCFVHYHHSLDLKEPKSEMDTASLCATWKILKGSHNLGFDGYSDSLMSACEPLGYTYLFDRIAQKRKDSCLPDLPSEAGWPHIGWMSLQLHLAGASPLPMNKHHTLVNCSVCSVLETDPCKICNN